LATKIEDVVFERPLDVVADEEVQAAVAVEVQPHGRSTEADAAIETAGARRVHERAAAGVVKQPVLAHAGHEHVGEAVVVVVADGHAQAVHLHVEASGAGHVGERAIAVVPVEPQRRALLLVAGPVHAVHEQHVLPAVAVVVQEGAAGPERLWQKHPAVGAVVVVERQASGRRDVYQPEPWRRRGLGRAGGAEQRRPQAAAGPRQEPAPVLAPVHSGLTSPFCSA
jgi:hypothetical protein